MSALFGMLKRLAITGFLALALTFVVVPFVGSTQAQAASCSFRCQVRYPEDGPSQCATDQDCVNNCQTQCQSQGMQPEMVNRPVCASRTGSDMHVCGGCYCIPQVAITCDVGDSDQGRGSCTTSCQSTCTPRASLHSPASSMSCYTGSIPTLAARCVQSALGACQTCIRDCINGAASFGTRALPADCYSTCRQSGIGASAASCNGIPQEQAIAGFTPAPTGAVSGSHVRTTGGGSSNEAASLPPGACVQRAIAADAANRSLISMTEATLGVASSTWTCRRVCSEQEQGSCVTGGCPGDSTVRCCPPSLGIAPAQQCGGRGTTGGDNGAAGGAGGTAAGGSTGGASEGGSANTGSSSSDSGGDDNGTTSGNGGVVGGTNVAADSGGLTRLILPSCTEDGSCQFSDIVQAGLNFIRFLFGLAGVLLLVVFVYAGIEYLIAGSAGQVKSAEDRIKKALTGLFFMFFGYTLVNFLVGLFIHA